MEHIFVLEKLCTAQWVEITQNVMHMLELFHELNYKSITFTEKKEEEEEQKWVKSAEAKILTAKNGNSKENEWV